MAKMLTKRQHGGVMTRNLRHMQNGGVQCASPLMEMCSRQPPTSVVHVLGEATAEGAQFKSLGLDSLERSTRFANFGYSG